ncbi:MFS transporter [Nonomuraea africana]|uniref:MFS family permease n=1 Tax=Nonomuraea africana TaxID=46171 RepID=A0ABR9K6R1_9ACTN|nr:MFS transporter [Nonomuraea africana]MBE1557707.1 MFS family permease [Nonomuraea africana]
MVATRLFGNPPPTGIDADSRAPYGWAPLIVLFVVGLVDRVEHNLLSGVLPHVQAEWGFSDTAAGSIPTASALAAAIVAIPAGYLADRVSRTRILAIVVLLWAVATLGSGLAVGFAMFYAMRVFLAAAECIDNPASGSLTADYYPPVSRAKAYGLTRVTTYLGGIGTLLGGVLAQVFDWRTAFLVMVVPGLITAWLCWRLREPARGHLDELVAGGSAETVETPAVKVRNAGRFLEVLRIPTLLIVCIGLALLTLGLAGIFFWMPTLMVRTFGVGTGVAGSVSGLITITGPVLGTLIGSRLGSKWHGTIKGGRLLAGGGGITAGSAVLAGALAMDSMLWLSVLTLVASTLMSIAIPNMTACLADVVGAHARGLGFAVLQLLTTFGGAFGSLIVGRISDSSGSLTTGMYALIPPMVVGGVITLLARGFFERDAARVLEQARR